MTISARGGCGIYREDRINHCPGCGRTQWLVGRTTAECAFCSTALPLESETRGSAQHVIRGFGGGKINRFAIA